MFDCRYENVQHGIKSNIFKTEIHRYVDFLFFVYHNPDINDRKIGDGVQVFRNKPVLNVYTIYIIIESQ